MKYLLVVISCIVLTFSQLSADVNILSLQTAIEGAMNKSRDILRINNRIDALRDQYSQSQSSAQEMQFMLDNDEKFGDLLRKTDKTPEEEIQYLAIKNHYNFLSALDQYEMSVMKEISPLEISYMIKSNENNKQRVLDNIEITVRELLNNLTYMDDTIARQAALNTSLEANLKTAEAKFKQGKVSNMDISILRLELKKAQLQLNNLKLDKKKLIYNINSYIGKPANITYDEYENNQSLDKIDVKTLDEYINDALLHNVDVINSREYLSVRDKHYSLTKKYYQTDSYIENFNSKISLDEAEISYEYAVLDVKKRVNETYNTLTNKLNELKSAEIQYNLSLDKLKETKQKYTQGKVTEKELTDVQIDSNTKSIRYKKAKMDAYNNKLKLESLCGIMKSSITAEIRKEI